MKSKTKVLVTFGVILAFAIGFIAGISTEYPKPQSTEGIAGTITKVKKFKNTKATENDIQLRDQLSQNQEQLTAIKNLLSIYYSNSILRSKLIGKVATEASKNETFNSAMALNIAELNSYSAFLDNSRADILAAIGTLENINESNPALIGNMVNQAVNVITQIRYRNVAVMNFMDNLNAYLNQYPQDASQELKDAFSLLATNELKNAILTKDLKTLKSVAQYNINAETPQGNLTQEAKAITQSDMEQLGTGFTDSEMLNAIMLILDSEKLGLSWDNEKLASFLNSESLNFDPFLFDKENLGAFWDSEVLGMLNLDSEALGSFMADSEALGFIMISDSDALAGIGAFDSESLGRAMQSIN